MSNLSHEFQKRQLEERQKQIDEAKRAKTQQKKATNGGLVIGVVATIGAVALAAPLLYSAMASDTQVDESMPVASVVQDDNSELEISESSLDDWDTLHADSVETGGGDATGTDPADPLGFELANPADNPVDSTGSTEPDALADQNSDSEEDIGNSVWEGTGDGYDENELSDDAISDDPADSAAQGDGAQGTDSLAQKAVDAAYRIVRETYGGEDWVPAQSMVATVRLRDDLDSIQVHYDPDVTHYAVILLRVQDNRYTYYECVINPVTEESVLEIGVRIWNRDPKTGALVYDSTNSHSLSTLYEKEVLSPASTGEVEVEVEPSDPESQPAAAAPHDPGGSEGAVSAGEDELTAQSSQFEADKYTITNLQQALMFGFVNKTENVTTTLQSDTLCWSDSAYGEWQDLSVSPSQTTMSAESYSPPVQTKVKPGTPHIWYFVTGEPRTTQISFDDTENSISGISYKAESSDSSIITCTLSASGITFKPRRAGNTCVQIYIYNKLNKVIGFHNFSVKVFNSWGECVAQAKKDGVLQDKGSLATFVSQDENLDKGLTATATADSTGPTITAKPPVIKSSPVISASNKTVKFGSTASLGAKSSSGGALSYSSSNPGVVKVSSKGVLAPVKVGSAKVTVKTAETSTFVAGNKTVTVTVVKGSPVISASNKTVRLGSTASLGAKSSSGGALSYSSSNSGIVKVSSKGVLTPVKAGSAKVTVKTKETSTFAAGSKAVTVTVAKKTQPMTVAPVKRTASFKTLKSKAVTVAGITVKKNQGGVTYAKTSGTANITINNTTGKLTIKKGTKKGTYKITVKATAKGNNTYAAGNKSTTATITVN